MNRLLRSLRTGSSAHGTSDQQLLDQFTTCRDEEAFAELVRRHGPLVFGVCRRNLPNPPDAEDAFQATFLVLVRRAALLSHYTDLGPWLYQVATSCCRTVQRGNRRRLSRIQLGLSSPLASPEPDFDPDLGAVLDAAVLALPQKYQAPVILCHLQGYTRRQAAERLGWPEGTLSVRLNRALAKLRARLAGRDLAVALAAAGAVTFPTALLDAAVRTFVIYTTAVGTIPANVLSTTNGVLRTSLAKKLRTSACALLFIVGMAWLGTELLADSPQPVPHPVEPQQILLAEPPVLANGNWELMEWLGPNKAIPEANLTIAEKNGKQAITSIDDARASYNLEPKELTVTGRRVTFTIARNDHHIVGGAKSRTEIGDLRFDGLFDPTDPTIVLGSIWDTGTARRAVLVFVPKTGPKKLKTPDIPPEWYKFAELANELSRASAAQFEKKPHALQEKERLRILSQEAEETFYAEVPKLFRKLIADRSDSPFVYEAAMELFRMLDRLKPASTEVDAWAKTACTFAAMHGPQFEAYTVGRIARILIRNVDYIDQAKTYAVRADKLATSVGMPAESVKLLDEYTDERAAWAKQTNPPAAGTIWPVTVSGRVTDPEGKPIADVDVTVNRTSWVKRPDTKDGTARTGPDGKYSLTLKCEGSYRLHIHQVWATKRGYIRSEHNDEHKLLPGESATIDFTLKPGDKFGGTLKVRPDSFERGDEQYFIKVTGKEVTEYLLVTNGKKFELTLPPDVYTIELMRSAGKSLAWSGLKTGRTDHLLEQPPFEFKPETVGAAFDEMWQALDRSYSYFALKPDIDWKKLKDEYRPKAVKAKSANELADVLKEMLGRLKDGHVWIEMPDGKVIGTHRSEWRYNGNRKAILDQLTDKTECGEYAIVGKTKMDGFGYFLMTHQSAATPDLVAKAVEAIGKLSDTPGFVVDLRNANGGSEPLALKIAELFCEKKVVYAKSKFRNGKSHTDFTEDQERTLSPAKTGKPYLKPVVCLLGPGCVSSGEGFAKMMAALPHVTTIGLPTRGSSGNPGPVDVGDSGLIVYFSRWVDLLPNGTPIEGKGVPPTIIVDKPAEAYKDADPTLTQGLAVLRAKRMSEK
jgi:RNA polymerase sigma factor (sigma-70 family)